MAQTHFGYQSVEEQDKARKVAEVFHSVAQRYDVMNDLMSLGLHRTWKAFAVELARPRAGERWLDIAGGTGDIARLLAKRVGAQGQVWLTDINGSMLGVGRDRILDEGMLLPVAQCDAEHLPFAANTFHGITVAFGLRNMTHKDMALAEMWRVLRPGGRLLVLEFSRVWSPLKPVYDAYSFTALPWLGARITQDADSYRYLAESIRMHPDQETLAQMLRQVGFVRVDYHNLSAGVVAVHKGYKV